MPLLVKARTFLRNLIFARRVDADLDQEVRSHLELLIEEKIREGMSLTEAQRAARMGFGRSGTSEDPRARFTRRRVPGFARAGCALHHS